MRTENVHTDLFQIKCFEKVQNYSFLKHFDVVTTV